MLGWWGLLRTSRKMGAWWELGPQSPQVLRVSRASPGSEERCKQRLTTFGGVRSQSGWGWGWGPRWLGARPVTPGEKAPHLQEPREAELSSRRVWALPAPRRGALGEALSLRVSLCYFFPPVCGFFFPWSCFIGIPVIKTWCSLGALMWPAAWAGPSLFLPPQGRGFDFWSRAESMGHLPRFSHPPPPPLLPPNSRALS